MPIGFSVMKTGIVPRDGVDGLIVFGSDPLPWRERHVLRLGGVVYPFISDG